MKRLLTILPTLLWFTLSFGQNVPDNIRTSPTPATGANKNNKAQVDANLKASLSLNIPHGSTESLNGAKDSIGYVFYNTTINRFKVYKGNGVWDTYLTMADVPGAITVGSIVTSTPTIGLSTPTFQDLVNGFYQSQPPTAFLSGGNTVELINAAVSPTYAVSSLTYTYGRQIGTTPIVSAVIEGTNYFSTQPTAPGTVSGGTPQLTFPSNVNKTFTLTVTTSDGKTATATTQIVFSPKRYWGRAATQTPSNSEIIISTGGSNEFSSVKGKTGAIVTGLGGSNFNYPFYTYPTSFGALTKITDASGFDVTSAFIQTTVSVTNATGYVQNYYVYTLNNPTAGTYTINAQ